jgi:hypothetical protein
VPELWVPGFEGPHSAFIDALNRRIAAQGGNVVVEVELYAGARFEVIAIEAEPGFGFITLRPRPDKDVPAEVIVPLGSVAQIRLHAPEEEPTFGFQLPK